MNPINNTNSTVTVIQTQYIPVAAGGTLNGEEAHSNGWNGISADPVSAVLPVAIEPP